ncbi:MAG: NEDD8-activating enzyme E1 regulatory subunit-like [Trebouxia sp. A1-2]|nr:MAG: NEDD8-activating enzyme E1 regulatory subunit-like [Trebouxia sp. A1-2]
MEHPAQPDKSKKYDRQLRIWGAHGQSALESTRICLLHCSPTGSETLKNLVLGGIASFTIVDHGVVEAADLGNNFFLESSHLGHSRAQHVTELLKELNESVTGSYVQESPQELIQNQPSFFSNFDLVIATQLEEALSIKLDKVCRGFGVKLLLARSYGLVGYLRASLSEHKVIESKPDNSVEDLRFHQPWTELQDFADTIDLSSADDIMHKHIPYAILLIKASHEWQKSHSGKLPSSSAQRSEFKNIIKSWQRQIDGIPIEEENFSEALSNASKVWAPPRMSSEVKAIVEDEAASVSKESDNYWVLAAALKRYLANEGNGQLPIEGSLPDMTATTALYLDLQRIYREQADRDIAAVTKHVQNVLVVRYRTLEEEFTGTSCKSDALRQALAAEDTVTNASLYILLRAADRFYSKHHRYPGLYDQEVDGDIPALKHIATSIVQDSSSGPASISDDLVGELCRFGAGELHCVAAVMGGMASQEAIKLITKQFVPTSGTVIYNAMNSTMSVFCF